MPARPLRFLRLFLPSVLAASFLLACALPWHSSSVLKGKHPGGGPRYHVEVDTLGRKHGVERWWHENGTLRTEATYVGGRRDGDYRAWYPHGTPWYAGRDSLGVPVDTLRFWHPNGQPQSLSVYQRGAPVFLETWDSAGFTPEQRARLIAEEVERLAAQRRIDSLGVARVARDSALALWIPRVRATVETYWKLPESLKKTRHRAVARLRVSPHGSLLDVTWVEKSGSREFDRRAAQALKKVRKFPPPPPEMGSAPLSLRYEFTTSGLAARKRLMEKEREPGSGDGKVDSGQ